MAVPDYQTLMLPVLQLLENEREHSLAQLTEAVSEKLGLSAEDRQKRLPSGRSTVIRNRCAWARTYLKQAGLVEPTRRGFFRISKAGLSVLASSPLRIDVKYLEQFPGFVAFQERWSDRSDRGDEDGKTQSPRRYVRSRRGSRGIEGTRPLEEAVADLDRADFVPDVQLAEADRKELLRRFPRERWAEMTLEQYAIGHDGSADSFCFWMEFKALKLGSMRGGSAHKMIIYKHKAAPGWFHPKAFSDERLAWKQLRSEFIRAFELAEAGAWEEIDELETLALGSALKLKTLHLYFPEQILPVTAREHLRRYLRLIRGSDADRHSSPVILNRSLLAALRERPELAGWSTQEMMRFLYRWSDARGARRVFKIAPDKDATFWDECLDQGYICVGWDEIGDLRNIESKQEFQSRFSDQFGSLYAGSQRKIAEKAKELWTLKELEPGDRVVANQGLSKVLAVGEVVDPGYTYREDRARYKHTVAVKWDTSYARTIPTQKRWQFVTVARIPDRLLETILGPAADQTAAARVTAVPVDPLHLRIASALERKGQLILYGPPGKSQDRREGGQGEADRTCVSARTSRRRRPCP